MPFDIVLESARDVTVQLILTEHQWFAIREAGRLNGGYVPTDERLLTQHDARLLAKALRRSSAGRDFQQVITLLEAGSVVILRREKS